MNKKTPKRNNGMEFAILLVTCGILYLLYDNFAFGKVINIPSPPIYVLIDSSRENERGKVKPQIMYPGNKKSKVTQVTKAILKSVKVTIDQNVHFEKIQFTSIANGSNLELFIKNTTAEVHNINVLSLCKYSLFWNEAVFGISWKEMLKPCLHNMRYKKISNRNNMTDITKSKIVITKSTDETTLHVALYTKDRKNRYKHSGGDMWVVTVTSKYSSFMVDMLDKNDGSYEIFIQVPRDGGYKVIFRILHSLCEGFMDPPNNFFKIGTTQGNFQKNESVVDPSSFLEHNAIIREVWLKSSSNKPNPCSDTKTKCIYVNTPNGYWEKQVFKHFSTSLITKTQNIKKSQRYNTLLIFGDSLGVRFSNSLTRNLLCQALFKKQKNVYSWTYVKHKFFTEAQERNSFDNKDFNETLFLRGISDSILGDKDMQSKKSVAVINFGLHLVKSLSLKKVIYLFEKFLKTLQHIKRTLRSNNPIIIWKTTTASLAHMRRSNLRFITRKTFMLLDILGPGNPPDPRIEIWNAYTIERCCQSKIPILDVFRMSASYPGGLLDAVHYEDSVFKSAEDALLKYLMNLRAS